MKSNVHHQNCTIWNYSKLRELCLFSRFVIFPERSKEFFCSWELVFGQDLLNSLAFEIVRTSVDDFPAYADEYLNSANDCLEVLTRFRERAHNRVRCVPPMCVWRPYLSRNCRSTSVAIMWAASTESSLSTLTCTSMAK